MTKQQIIEAYVWIRQNNHSIPDDVLDLMKDAAIEKIGQPETYSKEDMMAAIDYGFNYATTSQYNGEVPLGNKLQWLQWQQSKTTPNSSNKAH